MPDLTGKFKRFFDSEHESIEKLDEADKKAELLESCKSFKTNTDKALDDIHMCDIVGATDALTEARADLSKLGLDDTKAKRLDDGLADVCKSMSGDCDLDDLEDCSGTIKVVCESVSSLLEDIIAEELAELGLVEPEEDSLDDLTGADMEVADIDTAKVPAVEPVVDEPVGDLEEPVVEEGIVGGLPANPADPSTEVTPQELEHEAPASPYEEGFKRACQMYEDGVAYKEPFRGLVETELSERAYSQVLRYEEGFKAGYAYQEQVNKDTNPSVASEE